MYTCTSSEVSASQLLAGESMLITTFYYARTHRTLYHAHLFITTFVHYQDSSVGLCYYHYIHIP